MAGSENAPYGYADAGPRVLLGRRSVREGSRGSAIAPRDGTRKRPKKAVADLGWLNDHLNNDAKLDDRAGWQRLNAWLTSPLNTAVLLNTELSVLSAWTRRVGRSSFEVGRT